MKPTVALLLFIFFTSSSFARTLVIYHDADYSGHSSSANSMAMGLETALSEIDFKVQGYDLKLVPKDHRGNVKRSKLHIKQFKDDPDGLFVLGGLHSPPYLANKNYINQNEVLLMVPWAAAGPITRTDSNQNWIFRLSIDDSKAGIRLADYSTNNSQCQSPQLLLENTGWGKSNFKTISKALRASGKQEKGVTWFEWNTELNAANNYCMT
jgi:branched-chain amino acid transport system substrate-binding protein